jgi:hypothetical protein
MNPIGTHTKVRLALFAGAADHGTAVAKAYAVPSTFNGKIGKVTIALKRDVGRNPG